MRAYNWLILPDHHLRYIVLDFDGRTSLIEMDAPLDGFEAFVPEVEKIPATIEFLPE
ncbi:MAG: hypothetical protein AB1846_10715 [Chloroflexota bacterium]